MRKMVFYSYEEIPEVTQEYIVTLADAESIYDVSLLEINEFFSGLYEHEKKKAMEDFEGGWAL
jgi:hypothetical protein